MVHEVILPKLGTNMEEGVIGEWRKKEGDYVNKGDVLLLVETSKALFEVEAEAEGYLRKTLYREGERVLFTRPVAFIADSMDEDISGAVERYKRSEAGPKYHEKKREELFNSPAVPHIKRSRCPQVAATPAARRLAKELSIDLGALADRIDGVIEEHHIKDLAARKRLAVYGAGLGLKQVMEIVRSNGEYSIVSVYDDNPGLKGTEVLGLRVVGGWDDFIEDSSKKVFDGLVVSLHSEHRKKVIERIMEEAPHVELPPLIDGRAILCEGVRTEGGVFVEAGAVIGPDVYIGCGVIVDVGATVSHDSYIGAYSHLSPGCVLSGVVRLEGNVLVGAGAVINSQVTIGRDVVITPGSAVVSDLPDDVVVSGNPARIIGKSFR